MTSVQLEPRHTGIASFFRTAPFNHDADIGLIGVPFDLGVTHRAGARSGPRAVRDQSTLLRTMNSFSGVQPFSKARVRDVGDCPLDLFSLDNSHRMIQTFYDGIKDAGIIPLSVGGDHSISLPILRALAKDGPVGMIHIDAHCDTGDDYMGSRYHHGTPFRRAVEEGLLDPKRVIQIGIRGSTNDPDLWKFSYDSGMTVVTMENILHMGWTFVQTKIANLFYVGNDGWSPDPVYLSFDINAIDPSEAPGTGTPEAGGIMIREAIRLLRYCQGINFIGGDLVEVAPAYDNGTITAFNAASILFEMLCLISARWMIKPRLTA